jgi:transcriptional regulator with XRE-family HTH domain
MTAIEPFVIDLKPLARKRRKLDVSQRQLAEWIGGLTGGAISNYERGYRPMSLHTLVACAVALGVPQLDLFEVHAVKGTPVRPTAPLQATRTAAKPPSGPSTHDSAGEPGTTKGKH